MAIFLDNFFMDTHLQKTGKILYILFLSVLVFYCNDTFPINRDKTLSIHSSYLSNINAFYLEIADSDWRSPDEKIDNWLFNQTAPFKYRILGKIPVYITFKSMTHFGFDKLYSFYISYLAWSFIFLFSFLFVAGEYISKYISLAEPILRLNKLPIFFVSTFFLASLPPVLFAFKYPVHGSPNDFLGYTLLSLSLLSLLNENLQHFILYTFLGIFCRETNLIIFFPFIFLNNWDLRNRIIIVISLVLVLVAYRMIWQGHYNPLEGAAHNYEYINESVEFIFLVFCHFWFLGILQYINDLRCQTLRNKFVISLNKTFLPATIIVLLIVFMLARVREIRIEFVLFFYYIPQGLIYIIKNIDIFIQVLKSRYSFFVFLIPSVIVFKVMVEFPPIDKNRGQNMLSQFAHFYDALGGGWAPQFLAYSFFSLFIISLIIASYFYQYHNITIPSTGRSKGSRR